ncbi:hypothetical protein BKA67DRAFT_375180 [Truncatella angustata]|uniref:DUF6594 domain-containing protein n=1 Tax=Truncatella angustata TaxID=152316 RepID=A0A9P8UFB3_9PEZI|nr:uncharacterized protein BKA67DRAFT_375180 [Truncatella angustata]KAH6648869.1 hypothetical protein BKA67DRAFT_375180 [Truncatella angustata]
MQRMRLRKLQDKLVQHAIAVQFHNEEPNEWENDLKEYTIQDYEFMMSGSSATRDPFLASGERYVDDWVIRRALNGVHLGKLQAPIVVPAPWNTSKDSLPIGEIRSQHAAQVLVKGFQERLLMATLGGFFLVGPMWLMVKLNDQTTSLITTTVFVVAFGLLMASTLDKPKEVMSSTAAYAAVLVVFVGLGTTDSA